MKRHGLHQTIFTKYIAIALLLQVATFNSLADVKDQAVAFQSMQAQQLIVKFKTNQKSTFAPQVQIQSMLQDISAQLNLDMQIQNHMGSGATLVQINSFFQKLDEVAATLEARPDIEYAEPNIRLYTMATPNDPRYNEQWHYFESTGGINLPAALDITEGDGAIVAVVDTGYRPHADLVANIIPGYDFVSNARNARDNDGRDPDAQDEGDWFGIFECPAALFQRVDSSWHGTHVAGTIAAVTNNSEGVAGIASKAKILPVRVLARCGGTLADIEDGMLWAAGISVPGVPNNPNPADVINLSLGGGAACDRSMQDVVNQITAAGTAVVAAAGNSSSDAASFTPAGCDQVITVASTNRSGTRAGYSNFGNVVEVAAPGGETRSGRADGVLSTLNSGRERPENDSFAFYQGTSMAAPHVAGVAALLVSHKPGITPAEINKVLQDTARPFPGSCSGCGTGIVDAAAALQALGGGGNVPPNAAFGFSSKALEVTFVDQSSDRDGQVVGWNWSFGDGGSSTEQNPIHTYSQPGVYSVSLTVIDNEGKRGVDAQNVSVNDGSNQSPVAAFSFRPDNLTVSFTDNSRDSDGRITGWRWDFGDGNASTAQNPVHSYAAAGVYTVTLTATDDQSATNSTTQQVSVTEPTPTISLQASKTSFIFFTRIRLQWNQANGSRVDLHRSGRKRSIANTGAASELVFGSGSNTYKICETGSSTCSNEVTVNY